MTAPIVAVMMGSKSDWEIMRASDETLTKFGVPHVCRVLSAHRTPHECSQFVEESDKNGVKVFICAAGGAAHLAGVVAAHTTKPVLAVPMETPSLGGLDSLLAMVQMPGGVPVGTLAIGKAGATNAALLAIEILALSDAGLAQKLKDFRAEQAKKILAESLS
jgi:5-(carboxyamino)imidazole ribonucleotide mutase